MGSLREDYRILAMNGGAVTAVPDGWQFMLNPVCGGYANAQIDDYGPKAGVGRGGRFHWRPDAKMQLRARFSAAPIGTAGFGFWNAPLADPTMRRLVLPQAVWFFYAAPPNDLPFAPASPGQGWFAATLDAGAGAAVSLIPLAPFILLANQIPSLRRRLWPKIQRRLGISAAPMTTSLTDWHEYTLDWRPDGCSFRVDDAVILSTPHRPRGPLGFVCWLDNQYMIAAVNGRFRSGVLPIKETHNLQIAGLKITAG